MNRFAVAMALLAALPALAQQPAPVAVRDAWARATAPGASTGAVYLTLTSPAGDKLTGVTSPAAPRAGLHETRMDGGIMRMRPVEGGLDLPPGLPVTLAPAGRHIMLEGLTAPLRQGGTVPLRLTFQNAPPLDVQAQVQAAGARGPGAGNAAMPGMVMGK